MPEPTNKPPPFIERLFSGLLRQPICLKWSESPSKRENLGCLLGLSGGARVQKGRLDGFWGLRSSGHPRGFGSAKGCPNRSRKGPGDSPMQTATKPFMTLKPIELALETQREAIRKARKSHAKKRLQFFSVNGAPPRPCWPSRCFQLLLGHAKECRVFLAPQDGCFMPS